MVSDLFYFISLRWLGTYHDCFYQRKSNLDHESEFQKLVISAKY